MSGWVFVVVNLDRRMPQAAFAEFADAGACVNRLATALSACPVSRERLYVRTGLLDETDEEDIYLHPDAYALAFFEIVQVPLDPNFVDVA